MIAEFYDKFVVLLSLDMASIRNCYRSSESLLETELSKNKKIRIIMEGATNWAARAAFELMAESSILLSI